MGYPRESLRHIGRYIYVIFITAVEIYEALKIASKTNAKQLMSLCV